MTWHYGSGFPKALDVGKAIDKQAGAEREVIGEREADDVTSGNYGQTDSIDGEKQGETTTYEYTAPATDAAKEWDGFKTALKPATEYVVVARKPLGMDTVAENVREWGTGALNIGECRIETGDELEYTVTNQRGDHVGGDNSRQSEPRTPEGRYPSNVVFDQHTAQELDQDIGETSSGGGHSRNGDQSASTRYDDNGSTDFAAEPGQRRGDSGGPSRYFYTSKATKSERTLNGRIENPHPTVKPTDLMEWLVKLVTKENQIVLDPFTGSGTTGIACKNTGRDFVGIERDAEYADVARVRCGLTPRDPSVVRGDDGQAGLGVFD